MTFLPTNIAQLKAWVMHIWAVTIITVFSLADRKPFRKWLWLRFDTQNYHRQFWEGFACNCDLLDTSHDRYGTGKKTWKWIKPIVLMRILPGVCLCLFSSCDYMWVRLKIHALLSLCWDGILWMKMILKASLSKVETETSVSCISVCRKWEVEWM